MIYVIVGPTGVGKSSLALSYAKRNDALIINGDAFQCYKEMLIGTAKPSSEERNIVPHYLFDIASVTTPYTIYDYQKDLRKTLDELLKTGKDLIIVGGSGLYLKSALYDFDLAESNANVDMSKYEKLDNDSLYQELVNIDYEASLLIHKNNRKRVLRAIQIYLEAGEKKSTLIAKQQHKLLYDVTFIGLEKEDRQDLYNLINLRVDKVIEEGLLLEIESLMKKFPISLRAFQAIGYKEIMEAYQNKTSIDLAIELVKKNSRNYAKRQYTYFKNQLPVNWFSSLEAALKFMEEK